MNKAKKILDLVEQERTLPGTAGAKDPYPRIVRLGLDSYRTGVRDLLWIWFNASQADKEEFQKYLKDTNDPLAYRKMSPEYVYKEFMDGLVSRLQGILGGKY